MESEYTVRTEVFEGPLEMLLQLVEKRKLFINDISLAQVADDYVGYTQEMQAVPIGETANFVVVAATLILIKSRSLLPQLELSQEEEESIEELQNRLNAYKQIRALSEHVQSTFGERIIFPRQQKKVANHATIFSPDQRTSITELHEAIHDVLGRVPKKEAVPEATVRKVVSLEDTIDKLVERVTSGLALSFRDFSGYGKETGERVHVIVSFLAVLELVKQGTLVVTQEARFSDIAIENRKVSTPAYIV